MLSDLSDSINLVGISAWNDKIDIFSQFDFRSNQELTKISFNNKPGDDGSFMRRFEKLGSLIIPKSLKFVLLCFQAKHFFLSLMESQSTNFLLFVWFPTGRDTDKKTPTVSSCITNLLIRFVFKGLNVTFLCGTCASK